MDNGYVDETVCRIVCESCRAIFYRKTVYRGLAFDEKCPVCKSRKLIVAVKDVTKLIEGK